MDFILEQFEQFKERYKSDKIMGAMFNSGWAKMEKYYNMTDESPSYIVALVLDPNTKWQYIESNWKRDWVPKAKIMAEDLWGEYKPSTSTSSKPTIPTETALEPSGKNTFMLWRKRHQATPNVEDEYKRYCTSECTYDIDPRTWWLEKTQQVSYPNLSKMALDILSIPAMSADPECLFSSAKLLITDLRNKLGIDIIEAFECLKSWYKIRGWEGESKWLEEVIGIKEAKAAESHVELSQTMVQTAV
jgi:hAT family protein